MKSCCHVAVEQEYEGNGFPNLAFRVPHALLNVLDIKRLYVLYRALRPGFGRLLVPRGAQFFPKVSEDMDFVNYVMSVIGEELRGNLSPAKIRVKKAAPNNWLINEYNRLLGDNEAYALPILYSAERIKQSYLKKMDCNGVDDLHLQYLGKMVQKLRARALQAAEPELAPRLEATPLQPFSP